MLRSVKESHEGLGWRDSPTIGFYILAVLLLYRTALGFGFNSDAFVLFRAASGTLKGALSWDHSYHYMPLTSLWIWFQHLFFGFHQEIYEWLNLIQHGVMAFLVCRLGLGLGLRGSDAFLTGILFAAAGSSYQVVLWSIVGANYFVSGFFYLLTLMIFVREAAEGGRACGWKISLLYAMALLSHEQSLSLLPVCFAFSILVIEAEGPAGLDQLHGVAAWCRSFRRITPLLLPFVAFVLMKAAMSSQTSVTGFGQDPFGFLMTLFRGILRCFILRADSNAFPAPSTPSTILLLLSGFLFLLALLLLILRPIERFLLLWCFGHVLMMQMAIGVSLRHTYLPTVPAVILIVMLLRRFFMWLLSRLIGSESSDRRWSIALLLLTSTFALLVAPGIVDINEASLLWAQADRQTRNLERRVQQLLNSDPGINRLYLLNPESRIVDSRFEIFSFQNGASALVELVAPRQLRSVSILHTISENQVASSRWTNQQVLKRLSSEDDAAILFFDPAKGEFAELDPEIVQSRFGGARMIDAPYILWKTSLPELPWREGKFPCLEIHPGAPFEAELEHPEAGDFWFFIHFLADPLRPAILSINGEEIGRLNTEPREKIQWTQSIFRLPGRLQEGQPARISLTAPGPNTFQFSRMGFLPCREDFSAQSTPEMLWSVNNVLSVAPGMELRIPVPDCSAGPCSVFVVHRREFQGELTMQSPLGLLGSFGEPREGRTPRWLSEIYSSDSWKSAWVSISPTPPRGTRILQVHFEGGEESAVPRPTGGLTELYWKGPESGESQADVLYFNPWILGLVLVVLLLASLAIAFLFIRWTKRSPLK